MYIILIYRQPCALHIPWYTVHRPSGGSSLCLVRGGYNCFQRVNIFPLWGGYINPCLALRAALAIFGITFKRKKKDNIIVSSYYKELIISYVIINNKCISEQKNNENLVNYLSCQGARRRLLRVLISALVIVICLKALALALALALRTELRLLPWSYLSSIHLSIHPSMYLLAKL